MCEHSMWAPYVWPLYVWPLYVRPLYVSTLCGTTLYVSTLCVTTLCETTLCVHSMGALYVRPLYVSTLCGSTLCEHSVCDHSMWAHRKVRKLPGKMNISSWAGCCSAKNVKKARVLLWKARSRPLQNTEKYENYHEKWTWKKLTTRKSTKIYRRNPF